MLRTRGANSCQYFSFITGIAITCIVMNNAYPGLVCRWWETGSKNQIPRCTSLLLWRGVECSAECATRCIGPYSASVGSTWSYSLVWRKEPPSPDVNLVATGSDSLATISNLLISLVAPSLGNLESNLLIAEQQFDHDLVEHEHILCRFDQRGPLLTIDPSNRKPRDRVIEKTWKHSA